MKIEMGDILVLLGRKENLARLDLTVKNGG
jgi:hypothetical protein